MLTQAEISEWRGLYWNENPEEYPGQQESDLKRMRELERQCARSGHGPLYRSDYTGGLVCSHCETELEEYPMGTIPPAWGFADCGCPDDDVTCGH